jgi:hypothetical protein
MESLTHHRPPPILTLSWYLPLQIHHRRPFSTRGSQGMYLVIDGIDMVLSACWGPPPGEGRLVPNV